MRQLLVIGLIALSTSGCAAVARHALAAGERPDFEQILANADANGDGKITRVEFMAARATLFKKLDRNGDGYLDSKDARQRLVSRGGNTGGRLKQAMALLDKDGDGRISRDEFANGPSLLFDRVDRNHDGIVDAAELSTFRADIEARRSKQEQ